MLQKLLIIYLFTVHALSAQSLLFGVVPQQNPAKLYKIWKPFIQELSQKTDIDIILKIETSIPKFEKNLYNGNYDIAYSNPYHYTLAQKEAKHTPLVRFDKSLVGILVSNKSSNIHSIKDTPNKTFAFPSPKAFAATILTQSDILEKTDFNINRSQKLRYVNSHDSVYLNVQRNFSDVGGGILRTFNNSPAKNDLRIIHTTKAYPSHPISIDSQLPKSIQHKIETALLSISPSSIQNISTKRLISTQEAEYQVVKELISQLETVK